MLALRSRSAVTPGDIVVATVSYRLSPTLWVGVFSRRYPDVRVECLTMEPLTRDVTVSDCWISGLPAGRWVGDLTRFPEVLRAEGLCEVGNGGLYRVTYQNPPVVYLFRRLRLPAQLPIWIQAGIGGMEVVVRRSEFRKIVAFSRSMDPAAQIVPMSRANLRSHLPMLTPSQRQVLATAMEAGYFEVPRRVNLTELARRLRRSQSGLSEVMAMIESKLLVSALHVPAFRSVGVARGRVAP